LRFILFELNFNQTHGDVIFRAEAVRMTLKNYLIYANQTSEESPLYGIVSIAAVILEVQLDHKNVNLKYFFNFI